MLEAIDYLESMVSDPRKGLPQELFLFISRLTPLVNVDLLIRNTQDQKLLTWRDDPIFGRGWHVPGGCVRLGESFAERIAAVAVGELGAVVTFEPTPLGIFETIDKTRSSRTHHISLLFDCTLVGDPDPQRKCGMESPRAGAWAWHSVCPDDLLQPPYRDRIFQGK
jgi:colanic acid biosynthesis protein WcaH